MRNRIRNLPSFWLTLASTVCLASASACGGQSTGKDPLGIEDIDELENIGGGRYLVRCFDGSSEVRTDEDIARGRVCLGGGDDHDGERDRDRDRNRGRGLICVARDNDGRDPWTVARITNGRSEVYRRLIFGTREECERSLRQSVYFGQHGEGGQLLICSTRDQDGRNPWAIWTLNSQGASRENMVFDSFDVCRQALGPAVQVGDSLLICAARDQDGRDPYSLWRLTLAGETFRTPLVYSDISECSQGLRRSRGGRSEILICASRDSDGRNPYTIYTVTSHEERRTSHVYDSFEDCAYGL